MAGWMKFHVPRAVVLVAVAFYCSGLAAKGTPFLIELRTNNIFDQQTAELIGPRASLISIRANVQGPVPEYDLAALFARAKATSKAPTLAYTLSSRSLAKGRSEAELLKGMTAARPLATVNDPDTQESVEFLDVTDAGIRKQMVSRLVAARSKLGVDGFVFDLTTRTPSSRPAPLAKRCSSEVTFCPRYASGMDSLFAEVRSALGPGAKLAYNGLFNFAPGQIQDQTKLLANFDSAAVEFFGMDPKERTHSFSRDILPFLQAIPALPADKSVVAYGRAPWRYTDYAEDFRWQRYLYASFLLAARERDSFQYIATFQVPTNRGRAGGIDVFTDSEIDLGAARGPYAQRDGLLVREFERGLVAVAPDDGRGGTVDLRRSYLTSDGAPISGQQRLSPGDALLLVTGEGNLPTRTKTLRIEPERVAGWKWNGAKLKSEAGAPVVALEPVAANLVGEHDLLLDPERSLAPYTRLEVAIPAGVGNGLYAVAEVDDQRKEYMIAIVRVSTEGGRGGDLTLVDSVPFRTRTRTASAEDWPMVKVQVQPNEKSVVLDGPALFDSTRLRFRRWMHLRPVAPISLGAVTLSEPRPVGR